MPNIYNEIDIWNQLEGLVVTSEAFGHSDQIFTANNITFMTHLGDNIKNLHDNQQNC